MENTSKRPGLGDALIMVDVQNDFLPGGKLAVKVGDKIGMNNGVIVEITDDVIRLRQREKDIFGNTRSELVELMMDKKEGSL